MVAKRTSRQQIIAETVSAAVRAGRDLALETVDFADPNRPKTCLEVDFPIVPVNRVASIECNASKPIYRMSKWWARRRSSVFRTMLLAAAMRAPTEPSQAARAVWDAYYGNHCNKGAFSRLKVADIFMGGGTTIVEGARLGMAMYGIDLNPIAWFVVKNETASIERAELEALSEDIEARVKPQIMPFYACDCPRGHKGTWTRLADNKTMPETFEPLALSCEERALYAYSGPEIVYIFWGKHGPCSTTGCGHRTPIMRSPLIAIKSLTVASWRHECEACKKSFDIEEQATRMAPALPLVVAEDEPPFVVFNGKDTSVVCPHCKKAQKFRLQGEKSKKRVSLSLLVSPRWLRGTPSVSQQESEQDGEHGGSATDSCEATARWNRARAQEALLFEVRGDLPAMVTCPHTNEEMATGNEGGTVPKKAAFACATCGTTHDILTAVKETKKTAPVAAYALQGFCPRCKKEGHPYGGRFFASIGDNTKAFDAANREWQQRSNADLAPYWPQGELPDNGFMTHKCNGGIPNHGFTHWWKMFNPRQLLIHAQLLQAILEADKARWEVKEFMLGAFLQYLQNQSMFTQWDIDYDKLGNMFARNNYYPKEKVIENGVFSDIGRGNWQSCIKALMKSLEWAQDPWEMVSNEHLLEVEPSLEGKLKGRTEKVFPHDPVSSAPSQVCCGSSTELKDLAAGSFDLVITDPPFSGNLHYSELADFFYVWLRLALRTRYPDLFAGEHSPKTLEVVANRARNPVDADDFYQRLLTTCWREAHRILKGEGLLAFTFHHSDDKPWVAVLESLFEAGFYLEATYPVRSDESKGKGEFGSKKIQYDIVHVCRKRSPQTDANSERVSWAKMRRKVLEDVRQLKTILEDHRKAGVSEADLQVMRRGKALEFYSRHYGKIYTNDNALLSVEKALQDIGQLLDENAQAKRIVPPNADTASRQFLRLFQGRFELAQDDMHKQLRGVGIDASDFEDKGWCQKKGRSFCPTPPSAFVKRMQEGRAPRKLYDYDQALTLVGACCANSGVRADDLLNDHAFRPGTVLASMLEWLAEQSVAKETKDAAASALALLEQWQERQQPTAARQANLSLEEITK